MPPCRPRRRKFWKFEEGYSRRRVMINNNNNNNQHQLDQPVITRITSPPPPFRKLLFFACLRFLIFHPFSSGGQLTPICPYVRTPMPRSARWYSRQASKRVFVQNYQGKREYPTSPPAPVLPHVTHSQHIRPIRNFDSYLWRPVFAAILWVELS